MKSLLGICLDIVNSVQSSAGFSLMAEQGVGHFPGGVVDAAY